MKYIGIDISVNSTAVCIYDNKHNLYNYTTKKSNYVWIKNTSDIINFKFFDFEYKKIDGFSDTLIEKIKDYDKYTEEIINDIKLYGNEFIIGIEGYNYGLKTTDSIIDISELSSILKLKLLREFPDSKIILIPPKSVKIDSCKMVYNLIDGQKVVRNNIGVAGGSFDKIDMLNAFLESNIQNDLKNYLISKKDDILKMKNIPKPFDDVIDSIFIMEIVKNNI
jgi:hypothetical protein